MGAIVTGGVGEGAAGWTAVFLVLLCATGLIVVGAWLAVVDAREHRLPGRVVRPAWALSGACLAAAALLGGEPGRLLGMVLGGFGLWALYGLLRRASQDALGRGDVRLAGLLGTVLGFESGWHVLWGTALGFAAGGAIALGVLALGRGRLSSRIPFGPPMMLGAAAAIVLL